jgi:hypothetical protein
LCLVDDNAVVANVTGGTSSLVSNLPPRDDWSDALEPRKLYPKLGDGDVTGAGPAGSSSLGSFARWYGVNVYENRSYHSRPALKCGWNGTFHTLFTCIKEDEPTLTSPLMVHVGR